MALATSNLSVNSILSVLGKTKPKDIFRNADSSLKTTNQIWAIVNKWGLSSYCPGTTGDTKISNLLSDRKLTYFKGYNHTKSPMWASSLSQFLSVDSSKSLSLYCAFSDYTWTLKSKPYWISSVSMSGASGGRSMTVTASSNAGAARSGYIYFEGEPKFYGGANFQISVYVSQAGGQV